MTKDTFQNPWVPAPDIQRSENWRRAVFAGTVSVIMAPAIITYYTLSPWISFPVIAATIVGTEVGRVVYGPKKPPTKSNALNCMFAGMLWTITTPVLALAMHIGATWVKGSYFEPSVPMDEIISRIKKVSCTGYESDFSVRDGERHEFRISLKRMERNYLSYDVYGLASFDVSGEFHRGRMVRVVPFIQTIKGTYPDEQCKKHGPGKFAVPLPTSLGRKLLPFSIVAPK